MLQSLNVRNIVLIEALDIEFSKGLCVLTGETGAGKSILLDSLGLVLGKRAESRLVRAGEKKGSVTAQFDMVDGLAALLDEYDIEVEDDELHGGKGDDSLTGGNNNDRLFGEIADDTLSGNDGNDTLRGNSGDDILYGDNGDDILHGGKDNDLLIGGTGNDTLSGQLGNDTLTGGTGLDHFILSSQDDSTDIITDFTQGEDTIDLSSYGITFNALNITQNDTSTIITYNSHNIVELVGTLEITEADIIF